MGVDIFFVISGYLITSIILKELQAGHFSFTEFYMRRIRRILPMVYTMAIVSTLCAMVIFLPSDLEKFGQSLMATTLFGSNIYFLSESGYFTAPAATKPLLHTWSLSVEEQFYIIFPVLLFLVHRFWKSRFRTFILLLATTSLLISVVDTHRHAEQAFFLAHTRAWEFLLGSILSTGFVPQLRSKKAQETLGLLGIILLIAPIFLYEEGMKFPGISALPPCLGAALLIYVGNTPHNLFTKKLLSSSPFVYTGLRSYSLYLWHWPLIVFASYLSPSALTITEKTLIAAATFALSEFSYRYIETPFRSKSILETNAQTLRIVAMTSIFILALGGTLIFKQGDIGRYKGLDAITEEKKNHIDYACIDIKAEDFIGKKCKFGDTSQTKDSFIIWGDSHAYAITPGIAQAALTQGKRGTLSSNSGCPPLLTVTNLRADCSNINKLILSQIEEGTIVFLAARWTYYQNKSPINREGPVWLEDIHSSTINNHQSAQALHRGLEATIKAIQDKQGIPVLVGSGPEFYKDVPEAIYLSGHDVKIERQIVENRNADISSLMSSLSQKYDIKYINTLDTLCDQKFCYGSREGNALFFDNDHLNTTGAELLSPSFETIFIER